VEAALNTAGEGVAEDEDSYYPQELWDLDTNRALASDAGDFGVSVAVTLGETDSAEPE
jgi:hypothetical protein